MAEDAYKRFARRLDAIPNGFPATESGVELELLARLCTPDEAAVAAVMRLVHESASEIAARAGQDERAARRNLKSMYRKGLIRARKGNEGLTFALMPFIVGIYEEQLKHMDAELARLFERYYQESRGVVADYPPAVHRVLPVEQAIPLSLEVFPYERASELVEEARSWGVRDCICRVQQHLVGKGCRGPVENCVMLAPVEHAFDRSETSRPITKDDALRILREAADAGMVHSTGNFRDRHYYICNCCMCCCGILRAVAEFHQPAGLARSDFRAVVDADECVACGDCLSRCPFHALSVRDDACTVDVERCVGCGLCVSSCPTNALLLERRPEGQVPRPPADLKEWTAERARERGISLADLV